MTVEERRRHVVQRALREAFGDQVADTMMELVTPSGEEMATRRDVMAVGAAVERLDERLDERLAVLDARWTDRMEALEHRLSSTFDRRIADAVTHQTRTLVLSQLGALAIIAGLAFGLR